MYFTWCSSVFLRFLKFLQMKQGGGWMSLGKGRVEGSKSVVWSFFKISSNETGRGLNVLGVQFCSVTELFGSPLLYFNFENLREQNSTWFIWFQCILNDTESFFSLFQNFLKLEGESISWGNNSVKWLKFLVPPSVFT